MQLPPTLIRSLEGLPGFDEKAFIDVHNANAPVTSVRLNPLKTTHVQLLTEGRQISAAKVPWSVYGYYLDQRPSFTFDPLFHAGTYYVQEASSLFLEEALRQTVDLKEDLKILDLCAAPGGKSTHLQSLIAANSLLVSNEVIRSRASVLRDNIVKWGASNVAVTNNDPKDFARLPGFFDVVVVDAPCSGSGLFRRDSEAIEEWSENNVMLCSQRQQRILADVLPALKQGGVLVYSTCSYSRQEDEAVLQWLAGTFDLEPVTLQLNPAWNIIETQSGPHTGYRFWPHLLKGEGLFMTVLRKNAAAGTTGKYRPKTKALSAKAAAPLGQWLQAEGSRFVNFGDKIYAWPEPLFEWLDFLAQQLKIIYSGTLAGEMIRDKLIPDHALAMSPLITKDAARLTLSEEDAIRYLQRKELADTVPVSRGWQLAAFRGFPIGWMNVLANRINNYYPKELRILKEQRLNQ
ncbi:Fmu (Sun) domain protein [Niabella ginsenosidivorans]|uniref:Fmu (Sun) domain protein n=1 Tax=Niabella ginsenosidivorans TaxID=1176587 RepID=A0A1A9I1A6_9BACT|nr:RsmF rRNA methyltransferase first C-terminal domain-containing protein [Niabella ginsenosidivorans]ANH81115.1 Fmu (Sun) domain protein [Niabella ginsenosidivorans]